MTPRPSIPRRRSPSDAAGWRCVGVCLLLMLACRAAADQPVQPRTTISQHGITWRFDRAHVSGQFITGDWWVVGPVVVESVSPAPGPVATDRGQVRHNQYGATLLQPDPRMRHGSMIVERAASNQGYDSRLKNYSPDLSVQFPVTLAPGVSLISTISGCLDDQEVPQLFHQRMWKSEKTGRFALQSAAVLTVLDAPPPADAFRPPYAGSAKPIFTFAQVETQRLLSLPPADAMPQWSEFERYFERPWLDHTTGWLHQITGPYENQVNYGREFARMTGLATLMLNTDAPLERKRRLLIGMVQLGIDLFGVTEAGRHYHADGGHYSGRKWPILFAGHLLQNEAMLQVARHVNFAEDQQTYYGTGWAGQRALFQIVAHTGRKPPHEQLPPLQWTRDHRLGESYRLVNGPAWPATALSARLMGLAEAWNHDAFFDYADRWMATDDPLAAFRAGQPKPYHQRAQVEGRTYDAFADQMWRRYRGDAPALSRRGPHRKWVANPQGKGGQWQVNPRPTEQEALAHAREVSRDAQRD